MNCDFTKKLADGVSTKKMRLLYPLHCGDPIMFELGSVFWPANLELDTEWYVAFGGVKFWLHTKTKYRILLLN